MEADLAFKGVDLRDLYRPGVGLTLRRLWVLIQGLPLDSLTWQAIQREHEKALIPTADKIRERQEHYRQKAEEAT